MKNYKKYVCSISQLELSMTVIIEYCVKNPPLSTVKDILKKRNIYRNKKFILYFIECEWELVFVDSNRLVKSSVILNIGYPDRDLSKYLTRKINHFKKRGMDFLHISKVNLTFLTDLREMSLSHYLQIPKQMIE